MVLRIARHKAVRGNDTTNVAKRNLPRRADGLAVVSAQVHVEPAHDDGHSTVRAHGDQVKRGVLRVDAGRVVDRHQHGEADEGDHYAQDGEHEAVSQIVGGDGGDHGETKGGGPGRDRVQLRLDGRVVVGADDGGREVSVGVSGHDQAQVHEAAEPDAVIGERLADVLERDLALSRGVPVVGLQHRLHVLALGGLEEARLLGEGGEGEEEDDARDDGHDTFNNKNPAPAAVALEVVHLADRRSQEAAEGTRQGGGGEKERVPLLRIGALVPRSQQEEAAWEHGALEDAQEETGGEQTAVVLDETLEDGDETEADAADGQPDAGGELLEQDVTGDLENDVRHEEDG